MGWQYLDPNGDGTVSEDDLMPVIAKRLQTKETVDNLLVFPRPFDGHAACSAPAATACNAGPAGPLRHTLSP